ncbi:MAG: amidoligase family protein [Brevinema sp.]
MDMRKQNFGIELEMTGISRKKAAEVIAGYLNSHAEYVGGYYEKWKIRDALLRDWTVMFDSSIAAVNSHGGAADSDYKVEVVSPICQYEDIPYLQQMVIRLKESGAVVGERCGIHIHINAAPYDAKSLRNITNIMASKEDLIYKALQVTVERERRYCHKVDENFLENLNNKKPKSIEAVKQIWYEGEDGSDEHYHDSRYHCLNLHSVFSKGTVEFRLFNGTMNENKIRAYVQFCLAISQQALTQNCASRAKTHSSNEKYTFRTWLLRLGMIGDEFKETRKILLEHLEGGIAWKNPEQAEKQKERLRQKSAEQQQIQEETAGSCGFSMHM